MEPESATPRSKVVWKNLRYEMSRNYSPIPRADM